MKARPGNAFVNRVSRYTGRFVCIGCLIWFGITTARVVDAGFASGTVATSDFPEPAGELQILEPQPGYWTFAGSDLTFERGANKGVRSLFESNTDTSTSVPGKHSVDASQIVALAKSFGAEPVATPSGSIWNANTPGLRMRVVASDTTPPKLLSAVIATKTTSGDWETIELRPRAELGAGQHLLPLPADAVPSCTRVSTSVSVQMQLFATSLPASRLLGQWRSAGWNIRPAPWNESDGFAYLCSQNETVVYAWSNASQGKRTIMLSRATRDEGLKE